MRPFPPALRNLLVVCLLASGCSSAHTAPAPPLPETDPASLPAVEIAARLNGSSDGLPDAVGISLHAARRALMRRRLDVQVVAFGEGGEVTGQYPTGGEPVTPGTTVTLWVGTPAAPPPPPRPEPVRQTADVPVPMPALRIPGPEELAPVTPPEPPETPESESPPDPSHSPPPQPTGQRLRGTASWYGPGFEGRRTACGNPFDPTALTLASRELPCGTEVRVTGPGGRTVDAVVDDWGPAEWTGRRFDLSRASFAAVADLGAGVIDVTVEILES